MKLGCLNALQRLLRQNKVKWSVVCELAAKFKHLEVLKWARTKGWPWHSGISCYAVQGGLLEILQWARANGCPWDDQETYMAHAYDHPEVLQWLRANGCPEFWHESDYSSCSVTSSDGDVIGFLSEDDGDDVDEGDDVDDDVDYSDNNDE